MTSVEESGKQLDFRDIHEHPPADPSPVVPDPSWDAQKVYFNEFDADRRPQKGDEFDDIFQEHNDVTESDLAIQLIQLQQLDDIGATKHDDRLDPLGWPLEQPVTKGPSNQFQTSFSNDKKSAVDLGEENNEEEDDETDLLGTGEHSSVGAIDPTELVEDVCTSVSKMFCGDSKLLADDANDDAPTSKTNFISKEERIKLYENISRDEDSSVDEPEDEDASSEEEDAQYTQQDNQDDEDDSYCAAEWEIPKFDLNNNVNDTVTPSEGVEFTIDQTDFASFEDANLPVQDVTSESEPKKKRMFPKVKLRKSTGKDEDENSPKKGSSLLLKPPSEEKLKQWENAKAKQAKIGKPF